MPVDECIKRLENQLRKTNTIYIYSDKSHYIFIYEMLESVTIIEN